MPDLILRPCHSSKRPWILQLRYHDSIGPTYYHDIARVTSKEANEIVKAGAAYFLYKTPKERTDAHPKQPSEQ